MRLGTSSGRIVGVPVLAVPDANPADRLAADFVVHRDRHRGAHALERADEAEPARIEADAVELDRGPGQRRGRAAQTAADDGSPGTPSVRPARCASWPPSTDT